MNRRHCQRPWLQALLMLAVSMQLCAPLLHAQAMAAAPAQLVSTAFCGSQQLGQRLQLRNQLPAEVRALIASSVPEAASASAPACDDCVCASPAALPPMAACWVAPGLTDQPFADRRRPQAALPGRPLLPPSTGPPALAIARMTGDGPTAVVLPDL